MERSLSTRNSREIRGCKACKAAGCLESKREGVSCHKSGNWHLTIRHLGSVLRERKQQYVQVHRS